VAGVIKYLNLWLFSTDQLMGGSDGTIDKMLSSLLLASSWIEKIMGAILRANLAAWLYLAQAKYLALGLNKV